MWQWEAQSADALLDDLHNINLVTTPNRRYISFSELAGKLCKTMQLSLKVVCDQTDANVLFKPSLDDIITC